MKLWDLFQKSHKFEKISSKQTIKVLFMDVRQAYNIWAEQYDTNQNKTRELEAMAQRAILQGLRFDHCLEIGCGTGKNTQWLLSISDAITAVDQSEQMLERAQSKISSTRVNFLQADISKPWEFGHNSFDLVSFSLVLEHIEDLDDMLRKVSGVLSPGGSVYIGELHPFKQYTGTRARFDMAGGQQIVSCFDHHLSDFTRAALRNGLEIVDVNEFFDEMDKSNVPRILTLLLKKVSST